MQLDLMEARMQMMPTSGTQGSKLYECQMLRTRVIPYYLNKCMSSHVRETSSNFFREIVT